jgi:hypothetical protein
MNSSTQLYFFFLGSVATTVVRTLTYLVGPSGDDYLCVDLINDMLFNTPDNRIDMPDSANGVPVFFDIINLSKGGSPR